MREGVYTHVSGLFEGGHSVKILGWGTDDTTSEPYWLVANSWGVSWVRTTRGSVACRVLARSLAGSQERSLVTHGFGPRCLQGEEKGFFRIRRGTDECYIESNAIAGLPTTGDGQY